MDPQPFLGRGSRVDMLLAVLAGLLLGLAFPPSPLYTLAYVAFIPMFILMERLATYKQFFRYSYLFLFVFHVITLYWTGGWTHGRDGWLMVANTGLLVLHPLFYMPSLMMAWFVKKRFGRIAGLVAFAALWISFEYAHSLSEFSFPWVTIGNSQAYDLIRAQIVVFTSAYGLSAVLLAFNVVAFMLLFKLASQEWELKSRQVFFSMGILLVLYCGPLLYGIIVRATYQRDQTATTIRIAAIQPNIDPWEKWGEGFSSKWSSYQMQLAAYLAATRKVSEVSPDLVIWPETAIPFPILLPAYGNELQKVVHLVDSVKIPVFTGFSHVVYVDSAQASVTAQRLRNGSMFVESYNSAMFIEPGNKIGNVYKKIVLVPFAERIPHASTFRFLIEPLKWNVGISSWGKGEDTLVFVLKSRAGKEIKFSGMICYESVYPNYVREFVKKGAEFLVVITNDSWWGNTSGTYQHAAYASLRAIENRRWVVQCANGGISEIVDPLGNVSSQTGMFTSAELVGEVETRSELTFYTRHGDVFAQLCLFCSAVFVIMAAADKMKKR